MPINLKDSLRSYECPSLASEFTETCPANHKRFTFEDDRIISFRSRMCFQPTVKYVSLPFQSSLYSKMITFHSRIFKRGLWDGS